MTMSESQAKEWLEGIAEGLELIRDVTDGKGTSGMAAYATVEEYDEAVLHVARHIAEADIQTLRESLILSATEDPEKVHLLIQAGEFCARLWYKRQMKKAAVEDINPEDIIGPAKEEEKNDD